MKKDLSNCVTTREIFSMLQKNKWMGTNKPVDRTLFHNIVSTVNRLIGEELSVGHSVKFPCRMGSIEVRKTSRLPYIDSNGKLQIRYFPDWKATKELWEKDKQAKESKLLIRRVQEYGYRFIYVKKRAIYNNRMYYRFNVCRGAFREMLRNASSGKIDAFVQCKTKRLRK